ncbi:Fringe-like family protein [Aspergillus niger]|uniref:Fringe-like family protein n=1 Tax=Aspergillus niger TaxID=5061 RepID=A0A505HYH1_ASPNG|nr:Fringe-like family protein [Aspergillus niger]
MATLCVLLAIALGFTANYDWAFSDGGGDKPTYGDAAICYTRIRPPLRQAFYTMLFSVLLITFSFVVRIVKLYRFLSVDVFARARSRIIWVAVAYVWGIYRLIATLQMVDDPTGFLNGSSDWTFGQVIAMLLLAGPLGEESTILREMKHMGSLLQK